MDVMAMCNHDLFLDLKNVPTMTLWLIVHCFRLIGFSPEGVVDSTKKWLEKSKELVSSIKKNNLAILESQSAESVERNLHYLNYQH